MTDEINGSLQHCKIGEETTLRLESSEQNRIASIALVAQARYTLDIVCRDLEHALYDNEDFYNTVKQLATSSPKAKIRVLIQDSNKAVKQGHRLVDLARRLSSFIKIRVQGKRFKEFNEAWLVVDAKAWVRRAHADKYISELNCSAARQLRDSLKNFDAMWNESNDDPNLRRISL